MRQVSSPDLQERPEDPGVLGGGQGGLSSEERCSSAAAVVLWGPLSSSLS